MFTKLGTGTVLAVSVFPTEMQIDEFFCGKMFLGAKFTFFQKGAFLA